MVIVCPECTTKFRVNPERIPDAGAKVRCARCKHVFKATKPVAEPLVAVPEDPPAETVDQQEQVPTEETPADSFSFGEPAEIPATEPAVEETADKEAFSYDQFRAATEEPAEEETFTFSSAETPDPDDQFTVAAAEQPDAVTPDEVADVEKTADEFTEVVEQTTDDALADIAPASDDEIADAFTPAAEPAAEVDVPAPPVKEKSGPMASVIRIILLLVLGILILGGVLVYMNGPEQVQQTIQQLLGQQGDRPVQTGQIALNKLEGSFISNQETGELFVIRGEVVNKFTEPRASIQVKGVIFDANGKPLLQKTIFVGNPISDQDLRSLPFSKIEELMGNQFGQSLSNMNVNANQAIPFAIVFRDLPKSLSEFSVNVTSSQPVAK